MPLPVASHWSSGPRCRSQSRRTEPGRSQGRSSSVSISTPAQHGVNDVAAADVWPRRAEVPEQSGVGAAGGFQNGGEDTEARRVEGAFGQMAILVGVLGEREDSGRQARRLDGRWRAEGVAENVA